MALILPLLTSFVFSIIAVVLLKPLAFNCGLLDTPNARKKHTGSIPLIGGIAIYIGMLLTTLLFIDITQEVIIYLFSATIILILGVGDDKMDLSVRGRILIQVLIALLMTSSAGLYLNDLGHIFYFFNFELGDFGVIVTVFAVITCINAFNMIDGIDGLAGVLSLITFISLAILLGLANSTWFLLPLIFSGSILAYLAFNLRWPNTSVGKVFLGDAGSMLVGLTIVWLLVIGVQPENNAFRPILALYIIALPLMDMAAIMIRRIRKGKSPFEADREHLHHIFERAGFSRKKTLIYISVLSSLLVTIGCVFEYLKIAEWVMFLVFCVLFLAFNHALIHSWKIIRWYNAKVKVNA